MSASTLLGTCLFKGFLSLDSGCFIEVSVLILDLFGFLSDLLLALGFLGLSFLLLLNLSALFF